MYICVFKSCYFCCKLYFFFFCNLVVSVVAPNQVVGLVSCVSSLRMMYTNIVYGNNLRRYMRI